jgi:hypothetical protein
VRTGEWVRGIAVFLAVLAAVAAPLGARAQSTRPSEADLAACNAYARAQIALPAYTERAPTSPFPFRVSGVGPYTGPITGAPAPRPIETAPAPAEPPALTGVFGAGGASQEAQSEPGPQDPLYKEAFDACMRARGF